jgi:hypothetical protein
MKALASAILAAAILIVGADGLDQAWAGGGRPVVKGRAWGPRPGWYGPRVYFGFGYGWPGYWWGGRPWWGPGWYGYPAYPYAYYPYAYPPSVVVSPGPQTYIEQAPAATAQQAPATASPPNYWYYCAESKGYYPYIRECPEGWMTVVPPSSAPSPLRWGGDNREEVA